MELIRLSREHIEFELRGSERRGFCKLEVQN